ncbi:MAG: hypothetical protein EAZ91_01165 [Cytophagales bacterium]|nr:MAG: hypothetical protein EAZ91_01165 [Cytophagales bacterium]
MVQYRLCIFGALISQKLKRTQMQPMRLNRLFTYALLFSLPLWLANCGGSGNGTDVTPTVEGSWKLSALRLDPGITVAPIGRVTDLFTAFTLATNSPCLTDLTFTFKNDGTMTTNNPQTCQDHTTTIKNQTGINITGTTKWSQTGDQLTLTAADGTKVTAKSTLTGTGMTWAYSGSFTDPTGVTSQQTVTFDFKRP